MDNVPAKQETKGPNYPDLLCQEWAMLDEVGQSAVSLCRYFVQLCKSISDNNKARCQATLGLYYEGSAWRHKAGQDFLRIQNVIQCISQPWELKVSSIDPLKDLLLSQVPQEWKTEDLEERLSISLETSQKRRMHSAHEFLFALESSFGLFMSITGMNASIKKGVFTDAEWDLFRKVFLSLLDENYDLLEDTISNETLMAKHYVREHNLVSAVSNVGQPYASSLSSDLPDKSAASELKFRKKIKATPKTVEVIRLIESGKDTNQITELTGKSAPNVRKIESQFKNDMYIL